jgi:hypothetical protein
MKGATKSGRRKAHMSIGSRAFQSVIKNELGSAKDLVQVVTNNNSDSMPAPKYEKLDLSHYFKQYPKKNYVASDHKVETDPIADEVYEMFTEYDEFCDKEFNCMKGFRYNRRETLQHAPREFKNAENPYEHN